MSKILRILISEEPQASSRSRVVFHNGKAHSYVPERTKLARELIVARLIRHRKDCFDKNIPLKLTVTFWRRKSKYLPLRETLPFRKPDLDNYIRTITDSLTDNLIYDDSNLTTIVARKRWSSTGEGYITLRLEEDTP